VSNYAAVGVAKALAESLMRYLAVELAPRGVRINAIAPAIVETDAVRTLFGAEAGDIVRAAASHNPTGRGVRDSDYTSLMLWLASPGRRIRSGAGHLRQRRRESERLISRHRRSISVALAMPPDSHIVCKP